MQNKKAQIVKTKKRFLPQILLPLLVFLCLTAGVISIALWYNKALEKDIRQQEERFLLAIADYKAAQISTWRQGIKGDAAYIINGKFLKNTFTAWCNNPEDLQMQKELAGLTGRIKEYANYNEAVFVDKKKRNWLGYVKSLDEIGSNVWDFFDRVIADKNILFTDLYLCNVCQEIEISLIAPIMQAKEGSQEVLGALILEINPNKFIFPLIQELPAARQSLETLLVERQGEDVLYLNELKFKKNTALKLRLPIKTTKGLAAAMAVTGTEGIVDGVDYRGEKVLAALKPVPDTPWYLIAKTDHAEIFQPLRHEEKLIIIAVIVLIFTAGLVISLGINRQDKQYYKNLYRLENERKMIMTHHDYLLKHSNDIIITANAAGDIIEANDRSTVVYGYSPEEFYKLNLSDLVSPQEQEKHKQRLNAPEATNGIIYETAHQKKDGTIFYAEVSARCIDIEGKKYLKCIIRDITERKIMQKELQESQEATLNMLEDLHNAYDELKNTQGKLVQAERMKTVARLASGVAHEVKNPLAVLLNGIDYLTKKLPKSDKNISILLKDMNEAVQEADTAVRGLLDFAKSTSLILKAEDLNSVVNRALEHVKYKISANKISAEKNLKPSLAAVKIDRDKIEQVFTNVLLNAVEAMPGGGMLRVITYDKILTDIIDNIGRRQSDIFKLGELVAVVVIEDTGPGIPLEIADKIFDPFFTTKQNTGGTGLGLSIVQNIINLHNAKISISNKETGGTRVEIIFKTA